MKNKVNTPSLRSDIGIRPLDIDAVRSSRMLTVIYLALHQDKLSQSFSQHLAQVQEAYTYLGSK